MRNVSVGVAVLVAVAIGAFVWASRNSAGEGLPYRDADVIARGEAIYGAECAACHGANLEGQGDWRVRDADGYLPAPPHDETGHTWHHPDSQLIAITMLGTEQIVGGGYRSNMRGFQDVLSRDEIIAVLAYIKSTWPPEVIDAHDRINADAQG
jgi:mono/diheme cytochrome c family protein